MNAYTTRGRARIRQSDLANLLDADPLTAAASLRALEWRRGCQAEAELDWLLKQHGVAPQPASSPISTLRRAMGKALVWAGERIGGSPRQGKTPDAVPAPGTLGTVG